MKRTLQIAERALKKVLSVRRFSIRNLKNPFKKNPFKGFKVRQLLPKRLLRIAMIVIAMLIGFTIGVAIGLSMKKANAFEDLADEIYRHGRIRSHISTTPRMLFHPDALSLYISARYPSLINMPVFDMPSPLTPFLRTGFLVGLSIGAAGVLVNRFFIAKKKD